MKPTCFIREKLCSSIFLLSVAVCISLRAFGSPNPPGAGGQKVELGFVGCKSAIFVKPQAGLTISISGITYDSFGYPASFAEEIQYPGSKGITALVKVDNTTWRDDCSALRYRSELDGKPMESPTVQEFRKQGMQGYVALSLEGGVGGLWSVPSGGKERSEIQTDFSYDPFGRRQVSRQVFTCEGIPYEINYSNYARDDFGRLSRYIASFKK